MVQLTISGDEGNPPLIEVSLYRRLTGSKPPPQSLEESKKHRWWLTARKSPIGSTNNQWG
ncbi:hypothetical protein HRF87_16625 [Bacillus sp. CRN 9]|nr:hypothetical protein [Bacillus sp. CRN 9]